MDIAQSNEAMKADDRNIQQKYNEMLAVLRPLDEEWNEHASVKDQKMKSLHKREEENLQFEENLESTLKKHMIEAYDIPSTLEELHSKVKELQEARDAARDSEQEKRSQKNVLKVTTANIKEEIEELFKVKEEREKFKPSCLLLQLMKSKGLQMPGSL